MDSETPGPTTDAASTTVESLAAALPAAEFVKEHSRVIDAPPERVWETLHQTRWSDLCLTRPLLLVRGLAPLDGARLLDGGPVRVVETREPRYVAGGRVARPWRAVPELGPEVDSLAELARFDEPGWLKFGMDFRLHPLPGDRTRLSTSTLCEPTDGEARRRFARYWRVVGPFSGLIRHDMLWAIARRATGCEPAGRRGVSPRGDGV